jgi:hypothetical protein
MPRLRYANGCRRRPARADGGLARTGRDARPQGREALPGRVAATGRLTSRPAAEPELLFLVPSAATERGSPTWRRSGPTTPQTPRASFPCVSSCKDSRALVRTRSPARRRRSPAEAGVGHRADDARGRPWRAGRRGPGARRRRGSGDGPSRSSIAVRRPSRSTCVQRQPPPARMRARVSRQSRIATRVRARHAAQLPLQLEAGDHRAISSRSQSSTRRTRWDRRPRATSPIGFGPPSLSAKRPRNRPTGTTKIGREFYRSEANVRAPGKPDGK